MLTISEDIKLQTSHEKPKETIKLKNIIGYFFLAVRKVPGPCKRR